LLLEAFPREEAGREARTGAAVAALSGRAVARVAHVLHEERPAARAVARGRLAQRNERHARAGGREPVLPSHAVFSFLRGAISAAAAFCAETLRSASDTTPPSSRKAPFAQKTGTSPNAVPRPPNTSGTAIWISLFTVRRMPSASPERPAGAWLYVSRMVIGCAQPSPSPSRNATAASSGACEKSGTRKNVAPAMKSDAVSTPI